MILCIAQFMFVFEITKTLPRRPKIFFQTDFVIQHFMFINSLGYKIGLALKRCFLKNSYDRYTSGKVEKSLKFGFLPQFYISLVLRRIM